MLIYSNTLTIDDLRRACDGITAVHLAEHPHGGFSKGKPRVIEGPGVRSRRIEGVTLHAVSAERPADWRELDGGTLYAGAVARMYGSETAVGGRRMMPQHATYNEHGRWMAALLEIDPDARIKSAVNDFRGREDFHAQTCGAYRLEAARLEELRAALRSERMSYGELAELQSLAPYVQNGDVELLEAAGVPEEQARAEGRI